MAVPRVQVLCLHHVFKDEEEEFAALVEELSRTHDLTTVGTACERLACGEGLRRPLACLTFDDGFANHGVAAEIIRSRGGAGTFFVCTKPLDLSDLERDSFCRAALRRPPIAMLGWREVERLHNEGHEIGCHTSGHEVLAGLGEAALEDEVHGSAELLRARLGPIRSFAWPFGRMNHVDAAACSVVARAGFRWMLSAIPGCHTRAVDPPEQGYVARLAVEPIMGARRILREMAACVRRHGPFHWR